MERLVKVVSIDEEFEKARTKGAKDIKKRKTKAGKEQPRIKGNYIWKNKHWFKK